MKRQSCLVALLLCLNFAGELASAQNQASPASKAVTTVLWPTAGWPKGIPEAVAVDNKVLTALDADLATGKYALVDSFTLYRCGKVVFERNYSHDYEKI